MQTILPAEFRRGQALLLDGVPHVVEELRTSGTAKTKHKLHALLRERGQRTLGGDIEDRALSKRAAKALGESLAHDADARAFEIHIAPFQAAQFTLAHAGL